MYASTPRSWQRRHRHDLALGHRLDPRRCSFRFQLLDLRARRDAVDLGAPSHADLARSGRCAAKRPASSSCLHERCCGSLTAPLAWSPSQPASERRKTMTTTSDPTTTQLLDGTARPNANRQPKWIVPVVIAALLVGGAGLGVGAYAVATTPAKTSGPQGRAGATRRPRTAGRQGRYRSRGARRPGWDYRRHLDPLGHLAQVGAQSRSRDRPRGQNLVSFRKGPLERWCSGHRPWCPSRPQCDIAVLVSDQLNEMADGCDRDRASRGRRGHDHDPLCRLR